MQMDRQLTELVLEYARDRGSLLPILLSIWAAYGSIDQEPDAAFACVLKLSASEMRGLIGS
jgi:NADH:ubiquinone oxidoreductase subunit E